jgi:hypothetical protein
MRSSVASRGFRGGAWSREVGVMGKIRGRRGKCIP